MREELTEFINSSVRISTLSNEEDHAIKSLCADASVMLIVQTTSKPLDLWGELHW